MKTIIALVLSLLFWCAGFRSNAETAMRPNIVVFITDDHGVIYDLARETLGTNTLFLFTSDHGAQWPFAKWNLYDGGIRVPFIAVWPGVNEPGTRAGAMISWIEKFTMNRGYWRRATGRAVPRTGIERFPAQIAGTFDTDDDRWICGPMRSIGVLSAMRNYSGGKLIESGDSTMSPPSTPPPTQAPAGRPAHSLDGEGEYPAVL